MRDISLVYLLKCLKPNLEYCLSLTMNCDLDLNVKVEDKVTLYSKLNVNKSNTYYISKYEYINIYFNGTRVVLKYIPLNLSPLDSIESRNIIYNQMKSLY